MKSTWCLTIIGQLMCLIVITLGADSDSIEHKMRPAFQNIYNVETLCNYTTEPQIFLHEWSTAKFQFGALKDSNGRRIHKCKINIKTAETFGLASAIEEMNIRGNTDGYKWDCSDCIEFVSYGKSFIQRVFGKLDIDLLSQSNSEKLCGQRSLKGFLSSSSQIIDQSSEANAFYATTNALFLVYHQSQSLPPTSNNSFSIAVTSFGQGRGRGSCDGMFQCRDDPVMCIHPNLTCNGHVNCAIPKSGADEIGCESEDEESFYNPIALTMIVLSGLVAVVLTVCILATIICQFRRKAHPGSREDHRQRRREELSSSNANDVPGYESVILNDGDPSKSCDLPPSYDALFPNEDAKHS